MYSSRVSPTNSETPSDLIYLADSSGSWLGVWSGLFPGCAAPDSLVDPHLLIVVRRGRGWKNYLGFGLHFTVSRSLLPSLLSLCWLIKQAIVGVEYYIQWSWLVLWNLLLYVRLIYTSSCVCAAVIRLWNKILANLFELVDCCFRDKYWLVLLLLSATIHNHGAIGKKLY